MTLPSFTSAAPASTPRWFGRRSAITAGLLLGLAAPWVQAAERAITKEVVVAADVDAVWAAWTTREGIVSFFAPDAEVEARVGGAFHVYMDPLAAPGERGADDMRFMALQPKRLLSFDWNAPPSLPEARAQRTFVTVRLAPVDATHTRVSLYHTGWGDGGQWDSAYAYFDRAWGQVLGGLQTRFETGPKDWTAWLAQLKQWRDAAPTRAKP
jgi:uncharacterized protein YndB with AHSA1/START domain